MYNIKNIFFVIHKVLDLPQKEYLQVKLKIHIELLVRAKRRLYKDFPLAKQTDWAGNKWLVFYSIPRNVRTSKLETVSTKERKTYSVALKRRTLLLPKRMAENKFLCSWTSGPPKKLIDQRQRDSSENIWWWGFYTPYRPATCWFSNSKKSLKNAFSLRVNFVCVDGSITGF